MKKIFLGINTFMFTFMCLFTIGVKAGALEDFKSCLGGASEVCTLSADIESETYLNVQSAKTIDLNNHKITFTGNKNPGFVVYLKEVTVKDGTIISNATGNSTAMSLGYGATLILKNMNVQSNNGSGITFLSGNASNQKLVVESDTTISCNGTGAGIVSFSDQAINQVDVYGKVIHTGSYSAINGGYQSKALNINVYEGATLEALNEGAAILQMCEGNINIYGGTLTGGSGIAMTEGTLNVQGGTITGKKAYVEHTQNSSEGHIDDDGAAIYLEPTSKVRATISGGTLKSDQSYAVSAPAESINSSNLTISLSGGDYTGSASKGSIDVLDKEGFVTGGVFSNDISKVEEGKYISGKPNMVSLTSSGETNYYIGTSTKEVAEDAKSGDTIEVLQGGLEISNVPSGVTVKNSGEGEVTVNGHEVTGETSYTVPATSSGSSSSSSSNNKDYNVTDNVTYTSNGEDIDIKGKVITEENDTYAKMVKLAQDRGYAKLFNMYDIYEVNNKSLTKPLTLTFNLGEENNGKYAYILHLKHDNTYEKWEQEVVNGKVSISVSELSPFIVALKDGEETKGETNNPQTSSMNVIALGLVTGASLIGLITLVKKNRKNI